MASHGIRDRVAIVGMGCTAFGESWDKGVDDLVSEAAHTALADAGVAKDKVDAAWVGTLGSGASGLTLSKPLQLQLTCSPLRCAQEKLAKMDALGRMDARMYEQRDAHAKDARTRDACAWDARVFWDARA